MPKRSGRRTAPKPAVRRRVQARRAPAVRRAAASKDAEAKIDGCDVEFKDSPVTSDEDLPQATGGVEIVKRQPGRHGRRR